MARFEIQYFDKANWEEVSDESVLELIQENFVRVAYIINELLQGKTSLDSNGLYRMKKEIEV